MASRNQLAYWEVGKSFCNVVRKLAWGAMVYYIWYERNQRTFKNLHKAPALILQQIEHDVQVKASQFQNVKPNPQHFSICANWKIPTSVFRMY